MKRFLLLLSLICLVRGQGYGQAMIGYNMSEVKENYPDKKWSYGMWDEEQKLQTMSFEDESVIVIYFFNDAFLCFTTTITPKTQGALQGWIENYNKKYVVVDDTNWKFYNPNGILKCTLEKTEKNLYYFRWYN